MRLLSGVVLCLAACSPMSPLIHQAAVRLPVDGPERGAGVLVLPLDIEAVERTAGGMEVPRAEWTRRVAANVEAVVASELEARGAPLSLYRKPSDPERAELHRQVLALHRRVEAKIVRHQLTAEYLGLPSKRGEFDWSLGSVASVLGEAHEGTRYALSIRLRDTHPGPSQKTRSTMYLMLGIPIEMGEQSGVVSVIDLHTGDVIWCDRWTFRRMSGTFGLVEGPDLRTPEGAAALVRTLLRDVPL